MMLENLRRFCELNEAYKQAFSRYLALKELNRDECKTALHLLGKYLMNPSSTKDVSTCFPQILLLLLTRSIKVQNSKAQKSQDDNFLHRLNCLILGILIDKHPDVLGFALSYFDVNPAPFCNVWDEVDHVNKRARNDDIMMVSDLEIVKATYNLLLASPEHFKRKWSWSKFYHFLTDDDITIKWFAVNCVAIVLRMSESSKRSCSKIFIPSSGTIDNWHETSQSNAIQSSAIEETEDVSKIVDDTDTLVSISGVLLPVFNPQKRPKTLKLIPVPSMESNLRSLALSVASRKAICLEGPVGCGKTATVEYLASITGHGDSDFIKVQLGDQTDSKMLLGTYRCTDIPGEFVWQPGVLTQAVLGGKWLLLEDIDSAALDVASVLGNLMETGALSVPGYRDKIYAKSGFQLFLTQRLVTRASGLHRQSNNAANLLEKHWLCVHMDPLSPDELITIVQTLFPSLSTVASRIVKVFLLFSMGNHENASAASEQFKFTTGRLTSTRDLIKFCERAIIDFNVASPESGLKLLQDAIDIFCCSVPYPDLRLEQATDIGNALGIIQTKADYYCNIHKPIISETNEVFVAGRATLKRKKLEYARLDSRKVKFSFTRPSAALVERVACCVGQKEPVLLVGETGTGKTSSVQYLARSTGHKLVVINMNQQSESADLLGGYKPIDLRLIMRLLRDEFDILFRSYFAVAPNKPFLDRLSAYYTSKRYTRFVQLMQQSTEAAIRRLKSTIFARRRSDEIPDTDNPDIEASAEMLKKWLQIYTKLKKAKTQLSSGSSIAFSFIEGSLIRALKEGHWVLLDEINLASSETLECLSGLLEGSAGSLSLLERGDRDPVSRHPDFTIFACMNPATDVGKKELPVGLRNRFTEFYVDELTTKTDLNVLVNTYLGELNLPMKNQQAIVNMYLAVRKAAVDMLYDGTGRKPHYSLRTLCRALSVAASNPCGNIQRSLYEAFSLSFLTQLDHKSYPIVQAMITRAIMEPKMIKAILGAPIPKPRHSSEEDYIDFEGYWVVKGELEPEVPKNYILTNSVKRNLRDLVRIVSIGKMPILLQGDTSVGKTSLITYLAKASGHPCVRINNHEHTDLQEYIGSYVADATGKLIFQEGVLVQAMRDGHWIILDELNLAPSDVLEALNRVLDDNRELFIPETQETVKASDNFMLFATQNPPGLYGGRKVMSRAFRNRFIELHFDEIPADELQVILHERCQMPMSYCKQIINVMTELQMRRKNTAAFQGKKGFITLRDLFRWGERYRLAPDVGLKLYDWGQHLAHEGYLVLSAKVRKQQEADEIRQVIKKHLKVDVDPVTLFTLNDKTSPVTRSILEEVVGSTVPGFEHVVWTLPMRKMAVLVKKSCFFKEPILLVGETGGGKTTVCQMIAALSKQKLHIVNCHMHTESSDFLGNLRPVRDHSDAENTKLFEWVDGPLITAMLNGDLFLADEISLADDSVLERLNSLLEPERKLLLAEKSIDPADPQSDCTITAHEKFHFIGTMNPGGDYGKKELSPALRNRFTEIWCEGCTDMNDFRAIIVHNLNPNIAFIQSVKDTIATMMLEFITWLRASKVGHGFVLSARDILTWVNFINISIDSAAISKLSVGDAYVNGGCITYVDTIGSGSTGEDSRAQLVPIVKEATNYLEFQAKKMLSGLEMEPIPSDTTVISGVYGRQPFFIPMGPYPSEISKNYHFEIQTCKDNMKKVLRGMQLEKPILLEGNPGVGKTSLITTLASSAGYKVVRINLSDQTDVADLFGADFPVEGGKGGQFEWRDGPFLRALRMGDWVLLDELNLASQSVLEGLNACFDHRGEIYIPELGKSFAVKRGTRFFACQNPQRQGGGRRGLPMSFLNRFTKVYIEAFTDDDLMSITRTLWPQLPLITTNSIIDFNSKMVSEVGILWAHAGSPWGLNLRDVMRWVHATIASGKKNWCQENNDYNPGNVVEMIYADRMRNAEDKLHVRHIFKKMCKTFPLAPDQPIVYVTKKSVYIGDISLPRNEYATVNDPHLLILRDQLPTLRTLAGCVKLGWHPLLIGASGCGKSNVVRVLAQLTGNPLRTIVVNSAMDTTEILGGFEQVDYSRHLEELLERVESLLIQYMKDRLNPEDIQRVVHIHGRLEKIKELIHDETGTDTSTESESKVFLEKVEKLKKLMIEIKSFHSIACPVFETIFSKLGKLSDSVKKDNICLNAGGKFEWVDSTLVKCLEDGSWLLLDQVNLCSPAVLDRLNGLLEPGGVLTIGERGADRDGKITTIRPHKNFRVFLTMDPQYGEISRAMRNRCIEIFMLGHKRHDFPENDRLDLLAMMNNVGLVNPKHQDALYEIHKRMTEDDRNTGKFCIVQLMHAAFLITQQISRGFPASEAFTNACNDVYIKGRYMSTPATKELMTGLIDEYVARQDLTQDMKNVFDLSSACWSLRDLQDNSKLAMVRRDGFLLKATIEKYKSYLLERSKNPEAVPITTEFINTYVALPQQTREISTPTIEKMLPYLLLSFYERSTPNDVKFRHHWLSELLPKIGFFNTMGRKSHMAMLAITSAIPNPVPDESLPWDRSWLPCLNTDHEINRFANRVSLILYLTTMDMEFPNMVDEIPFDKTESRTTVFQYSNALFHGKVASFLPLESLITHFAPFMAQINICVNHVIRDENTVVNEELYTELRKNFKWIKRFHDLGKLVLRDSLNEIPINIDAITNSLRLHYKWLAKFLKTTVLFQTLNNVEYQSEIYMLMAMLEELDTIVTSRHDIFRKITKRFKGQIVATPPLSDTSVVVLVENLRELSECVTDSREINDLVASKYFKDMKIMLIQSEAVQKIRSDIIELYQLVQKNEQLTDHQLQAIHEARVSCDSCNLSLRTPDVTKAASEKIRNFSEREIIDIITKVQLWPIYDHLFHILSKNLLRRVHEGKDVELTPCALNELSNVPSVPPKIIGLITTILLRKTGTKEQKSLLPELFTCLEDFSEVTCSLNNSSYYLHWQGLNDNDMTEATYEFERPVKHPIYTPILLYLVSELILNKLQSPHESSVLARATLGSYKSRMKQLRIVNGIVWQNSSSLNCHEYDQSKNDYQLLRSLINDFSAAKQKIEETHGTVDQLMETVISKAPESMRSKLTEHYNHDYINPMLELTDKIAKINESDNDKITIAETWILLGYMQIFLFANLGHVDPFYKMELRRRYHDEDIIDFDLTIYNEILNAHVRGDCFPSSNEHPRINKINETVHQLEHEKKLRTNTKACRPNDNDDFVRLSNETMKFRDTVGNYNSITKIMKKLSHASKVLKRKPNVQAITLGNDAINDAEVWMNSAKRFATKLSKDFADYYADLVSPVVYGVAQTRHGFRMLSDETRRLINLCEKNANGIDAQSLTYNLLRFPTIGSEQPNLMSLVTNCTSMNTREFFNKNITVKNDHAYESLTEQFRMVKSALYELYNHVTLARELDNNVCNELNALLGQIVLIWQQQRQEKIKKDIEQESMYKNKAQTHGATRTEEEEIEEELRNIFPTSRDTDFNLIEIESSLEPDTSKISVAEKLPEDKILGIVTDDDANEVHELHARIVSLFVNAPWIKKCRQTVKRDYIQPLIQRFNTFGLLLDNLMPALDNTLTSKLCPTLSLLGSVTLRTCEGSADDCQEFVEKTNNGQKQSYDFYKSSNVDQVKQCLPLLEKIAEKVKVFYKEWPEHPTLSSILIIVKRIYDFSITSPVSRFLTGLELLLVKMKEWEENAHSDVSIYDFTLTLTQQIIAWRKLELACWKSALDAAHERLASKASKWWFYLYSLFESYVAKNPVEFEVSEIDEAFKDLRQNSDQIITATKLTELLESFINNSTLVEFQPRLDLLLTFHFHVHYLRESTEREQLLAVLWNIYNYYKQFVPDVDLKIKTMKAPIEKKLKDFVKIARWNDINYWSVKETVEKTHRTLYKYIREYEKGLKVGVVTCLHIKPSSYSGERAKGEWDRSKERDYKIRPDDFIIVERTPVIACCIEPYINDTEIVSRTKHLLAKANKLCRQSVLQSSYPTLRNKIEHFIEDTIEHSTKLKNLEIDRTLPKPKQKSQAKSILQQKRMALADYFKTLTLIGVSYRTGNLAWKNRQREVIDLTVPAVDVSVGMEDFSNTKTIKQMLAQWDGCDDYYYKCIIKLSALNGALSKTQTDLGLPNMERCAGFSTHLMIMAHKQKRALSHSFSNFVCLKKHLENVSQIDDLVETIGVKNDSDIENCVESLKNLLMTLEVGFEQLEIYMRACPSDSGDGTNIDIVNLNYSSVPIINASRNDTAWESINNLIKGSIISLNSIIESFQKIFSSQIIVYAPVHYNFLQDATRNLDILKTLIEEIKNKFSNEIERSHSILESLSFFQSEIDNWIEKFSLIEIQACSDYTNWKDSLKTYIHRVECLLTTILLSIQTKYKDTCSNEIRSIDNVDETSNIQTEDKSDDELEEKWEENSFREKLVESLQKDMEILQVNDVCMEFIAVLQMTGACHPSESKIRKALLTRCIPLLRQYVTFAQFFITEQIGAFRVTCKLLHAQLNVFLDLATNGFCVPKDLDLEEGDGESAQEAKSQNGMGLGDGEGDKDVSERIESEDQLEDARPAGEEKEKPEDEDCKEEEKGIDMSEDFDGKMQDVDKNADDNEDESDDENDEDMDKEMGDTEEGAKTLDEEIWGDDDNESEGENEDQQEENQGKGEEIGEKEMTAKDDKQNKNDDEPKDDNNKTGEEPKEINEMDDSAINDNQIDPYHGQHEPPPEPEPLDLPDDINLDGENDKEDQGDEQNPFDIDGMKDAMPPPEKDISEESREEDVNGNDPGTDSNSDEDSELDNGEPSQDRENLNADEANEEEPNPEVDSVDKSKIPEENNEEENEEKAGDEADQDPKDKAEASADSGSKEMDSADQPDVNKEGSRDKVANQNVEEEQQSTSENTQDDSNNKGTGQAQSDNQEMGHAGCSNQNTAPIQHRENKTEQINKRKNRGSSDENRSLVDKLKPDKKKLKMIHSREDTAEGNEGEGPERNDENGDVDMCEHVKNSEKHDDEVMDAATTEQVRQQTANAEDNVEEEGTMDVDMHEDEEEAQPDVVAEMKSKKNDVEAPTPRDETNEIPRGDTEGNVQEIQAENVEVDGDVAATLGCNRSQETAFYTNPTEFSLPMSQDLVDHRKRRLIESQLSSWKDGPSEKQALQAWASLNALTEVPARDLAEKLRLVLEPTLATRLKGDYRTGKRINMRKIIPYIASQFRKDKIWLRRTKPAKRNYQIVLAVDDSSSMADNHSKELAFESLSLISNAMTYLEAGELSVIRFGEASTLMHPLGQQFTDTTGARLMEDMKFDQKKTQIAQLVDFAVEMFSCENRSNDPARLLVVLSDGRGVFSEGMDKVNSAVRRARLADIFLIFVIIDNPLNRDSILDIRMPMFEGGQLVGIKSYMDVFPFPFYMILRDINALPSVLSDALRQWFEIVGKIDT